MDWIAIVWSGFVATTLATSFFWLGRSLRWTEFSPPVQLGCLIIPDPRRPITETVGFLLIFAIGTTVLPALFRAFLGFWTGPAWVGGLIFGGVIGLVVAASLPVYGTISACVRSGVIPNPGPFGIGWGRLTPGIIFAGHMIYGAIFGAVFAGF